MGSMKKNDTAEGIVILVVILIALAGSLFGKSGTDSANNGEVKRDPVLGGSNIVSQEAPSEIEVSLSTGNAPRAYQSFEEYITLSNRGSDPVNITGWYLKNGKDKRAYNVGGELRYFAPDIAYIGKATPFLSPSGNNLMLDVILERGERAIITTGALATQAPYKIVSFKENICSGYLENMDEYKFTPPLTRNCPRPADEAGLERLDVECRKFIERLPSCQTPEFETRDADGSICRNCVNGKPLSNACVAFIRDRFGYAGCIANHVNDEDFYGKTWRIFLGRGWEMWAKEYETMELFDRFGRLISSRSY